MSRLNDLNSILGFKGLTLSRSTAKEITLEPSVLVALVKKRLGLKQDLYTLLQIFSLTLFEKIPILQLLQQSQFNLEMLDDVNQLQLLDI